MTDLRCQGCGEKLIPVPVKGSGPIVRSQCRNGHPTGYKGWWADAMKEAEKTEAARER